MAHLASRQPLRQGRALGRLLFIVGLWRQRGLQRGALFVDRRNITVHRLVEERALLCVHALADAVELQALELRQLEGEFVDLGVAPGDLVRIAPAAGQQGAGQLAQLFDAKLVKLLRVELRDVDHRPPV